MRRLAQGETVLVTRNGVPVGELVPRRRSRFARTDAALAFFRGAPGVHCARFSADLDRVASQDAGPRG